MLELQRLCRISSRLSLELDRVRRTCLVHSDCVPAVQVLKRHASGWTILAILLEFKNKSSLHYKMYICGQILWWAGQWKVSCSTPLCLHDSWACAIERQVCFSIPNSPCSDHSAALPCISASIAKNLDTEEHTRCLLLRGFVLARGKITLSCSDLAVLLRRLLFSHFNFICSLAPAPELTCCAASGIAELLTWPMMLIEH